MLFNQYLTIKGMHIASSNKKNIKNVYFIIRVPA